MLTNNFYNALQCVMSRANVAKGVIDYSGTARTMFFNTSNSPKYLFEYFTNANKTVVTSVNSPGAAFGTGSTSPTPDDYWLSGDLITTIRIVATTVTVSIANGSYTFTNTMTVTNSGTDTVVINELGIMSNAHHDSSGLTAILLDRTVFDTPLTLAPGEQGVITYTFNLPIVQ